MPPPPKPPPPHKMEFTTNSLRNTTLAAEDDTIFYEIVTRFWHPHLTKINKLDRESREVTIVAEIERHKGEEPKVRFGADKDNSEWVLSSQFMKFDEDKPGGTFTTESGIEYRWKTHKGRLQLVRTDDPQKTPLADFQPPKRHFFLFRMSKHAGFEVQQTPEITQALDRLIVSYLLVERRRRDGKLRLKVERS